MAPALFPHHFTEDRFGHIVESLEGRIDDGIPVLPGHHHEKAVRRNPCVVDQDIDPLQTGKEFVDFDFRLGGVSHVELEGLPVAARLPDQSQCFRRRLVIGFIRDHHVISMPGQLDGDGPTDPAACRL